MVSVIPWRPMRIVLLSVLALTACHSVGGIAPLDTADPGPEGD